MDEKLTFVPGVEIKEIPKGYNLVTVEGWCFDGDGRGFGFSMMSFALELGCFSPVNIQIRSRECLSMRMQSTRTAQDDENLIAQINSWLRKGHSVIFSIEK